MRPNDPKDTSRSTDLARVRLLLKSKAGWLEGYPFRRSWRCLHLGSQRPAETMTLERSHLSELIRASKKLRRDYPDALAQVVDELRSWTHGVQVVVDGLKDWVHKNAVPSRTLFGSGLYSPTIDRQAAELEQQEPSMRRLLGAVSWVLATRPNQMPKWLSWMATHREELRVATQWMKPQQAIEFGLHCMVVGVEVGNAASPLIDLAGMPAAYSTPLQGGVELVGTLAKQPVDGAVVLPEPELEPTMQTWAALLAGTSDQHRRRFLKLLARADLPAMVTAWSVWWPAVDDGNRDLRRALAKRTGVKAARDGLEALQKTCPDALSLVALTRSLEWFAAREQKDLHVELCRLLDKLGPDLSLALRAGLLNYWHAKDHNQSEARPRVRLVVRETANYLRGRADLSRAIQPWLPAARKMAASPSYTSTVDDELLDQEMPAAVVRKCFEAFAVLADARLEIDLDEPAERIAELMTQVDDVARAALLVRELIAAGLHEEYLSQPVLTAALHAYGSSERPFGELLRGLLRLDEHTRMQLDELYRLVVGHFEEHQELLHKLIVDEDHSPLIRCAQKLAALAARADGRKPNPLGGSSTEWIDGYPPTLRPALEALAWASPDAEAMAHRAVRRLVRDSASLSTERDKLHSLIADAEGTRRHMMQTRLTSIEARLRGSAEISPSRLASLARRLQRRAAIARVEALEAAVDVELSASMAELLRIEDPPAWSLEPRTLKVLAPLLSLSGQSRKLAERLLRVRSGPPPWDLRDAAGNIRFLRAMEQRGVDMQPWLEGTIQHSVKRNGIRHQLALEPDPLEIFLMGDHFDTCLSPNSFNFFSVLANAADINKRVLYLRDARGRVAARQLLCLTDTGKLVGFNPYSHSNVGFPRLAQRFASELAKAMNTAVAGDGKVPTLVAHRWYDDGIIDAAHQFDALEEDSPFRRALARSELEDIPELLQISESALSPLEVSLPMLLRLPEIRQQPARAIALLPWMRQVGELSGRSSIEAALLLEEAGRGQESSELFGEAVVRQVRSYAVRDSWLYYQAAIWLAKRRPADTLKLLRDSRPRGVRSWSDEESAERLVCAGLALETLHRPSQAAGCYQQASRAYGPTEVKRFARGRAKALEA